MRFERIVWKVICAICHVTMLGEEWPSHYRTKAHREAIQKR